MEQKFLNSREIMVYLGICENTLLKYERLGIVEIAFRLGNRKRYLKSSIDKLAGL